MIRDITIGQYYQTKSVIHELDPRVKLMGTLVFIISLFLGKSVWMYLAVTAFLAAIIKLSNVPLKFIVKGLKAVLILIIFSAAFNLFLTDGEVVVRLWKLKITKEGIYQAVFMVIRLMYLIMGSSLMTLTTTPNNLTDGLEKSLGFLKVIKVPVHEIAMMMSIALRFIPILIEETDKIMKAQMARGADFENGNLVKRAKAMIPVLVPLFISAFRRANELAMAMEARCIKLTVAYDGCNYSGWQIQPNASTIEQVLDNAINKVTGEKVHVIGASRTDAGVHGLGNVAVFDTASGIPGDRWAYAINTHLPEDVSVVESREVSPEFHPRHCNTVKTYEYRILNTRFPIPQFRNYSWHVKEPLDVNAMQSAAQRLVGEHDFKSFCCVKTQAESTVRTIYSVDVRTEDEAYIVIRVSGNGFLYNMIRIIAGTLVKAGKGKITPQDIDLMLEAKNRCEAGQTAPPQGLTLMNIDYVDGDDREVENQH